MGTEGVLAVPDEGAIRDELQRLVLADLLGPLGGPVEEFSTRDDPLDRYILGRLAPSGLAVEPDVQDELAYSTAPDLEEGDPEPRPPNLPSLTPSAVGFTACVAGEATALRVTASWARYERADASGDSDGRVWRRCPQGGTVTVPLAEGSLVEAAPEPEQPRVLVRGRARRLDGQWLVSLFLENRQPDPGRRQVEPWLFQVELSATGTGDAAVFVPRPGQVGGGDASDQAEQRRLAMAYRFLPAFAVGHGSGACRAGGGRPDAGGRRTHGRGTRI